MFRKMIVLVVLVMFVAFAIPANAVELSYKTSVSKDVSYPIPFSNKTTTARKYSTAYPTGGYKVKTVYLSGTGFSNNTGIWGAQVSKSKDGPWVTKRNSAGTAITSKVEGDVTYEDAAAWTRYYIEKCRLPVTVDFRFSGNH